MFAVSLYDSRRGPSGEYSSVIGQRLTRYNYLSLMFVIVWFYYNEG